ncbi:MAG: hypothetical protein ACFCUI_05045 [Bernardetiaceae bacterium]
MVGYAWCFLATACLQGQSRPEARLYQPSIKVGEAMPYLLEWTHDPTDLAFFPDTGLVAIAPLEWQGKRFFPTSTREGISTDSVLYTFTTFALDSVQEILVPVLLLNGRGDTQRIYPKPLSFSLRYAFASLDTLQQAAQQGPAAFLKSNTRYAPVRQAFNTPYWIAGTLVVLVVAALLYAAFGKRIMEQWQRRRYRREYERFLAGYNAILAQGLDSPQKAGEALALWKAYLERLRQRPYTSYTAREIAGLHPEAQLQQPLRTVDRAVYGRKIGDDTELAFTHLRQYATEAYRTSLNLRSKEDV